MLVSSDNITIFTENMDPTTLPPYVTHVPRALDEDDVGDFCYLGDKGLTCVQVAIHTYDWLNLVVQHMFLTAFLNFSVLRIILFG